MLYKINTEFQKYSTEESVNFLIEDLENNKNNISILNLSFNTFIPEIFEKVFLVVNQINGLKHVILESIFDSLNYTEMCECLKIISKYLPKDVIAFELPSNAVSCKFPEEFGIFLQNANLKILNLHDCGLGEDGLIKISEYLSKSKYKESLTSLNLSKNRINIICDKFVEIFSEFKNLEKFVFYSNTIEEQSMSNFLKNVKNEKLNYLHLSDNTVCGEGIEYLGEIFLKNSLSHLYLQDIKIDDGDIKKLLEIMNKKLKNEIMGGIEDGRENLWLDISCNRFEQDCVTLLENLTEIFKFKKLIIFENYYDDISNLKELVIKDGGILIDDEDDLNKDEILVFDDDILKKLKII